MTEAIDRLEQWANVRRQAQTQEDNRRAAAQSRLEAISERFDAMLSEETRERIAKLNTEAEARSLFRWIRDILDGRSRLPECLSQDVLRRLVQIRLDEADQIDLAECVCLRCGLQYPKPKEPPMSQWPQPGCPACGASTKVGDMNWAHLVEDGYWLNREATAN
jgi:hypothetical protein